MNRPNLSGVAPEIVAYIEELEARLATRATKQSSHSPPVEPSEPPTTVNIISLTASGMAKRTPRHHYARQRRSGMGVFDLESDVEPPALLVAAEEADFLLFITTQGRAFRVPVAAIVETDVRGGGQPLPQALPLRPDEQLAIALPDRGGTFLTLVTTRGQTRRIGSQSFGANLRPGAMLIDTLESGAPAAAAWTSGDGDLFIATAGGRAIRFAARQVPVRGCLGIRVDPDDHVVGVTSVNEQDGVFLLGHDGKGTIRLMSGFGANKAPGAGGKIAMKTDKLVGLARVPAGSMPDLFLISELGKIIRFDSAEVPPKEGVVQGVNCMQLRNDTCVALTSSG
jgi:DNA gyrase subunit A